MSVQSDHASVAVGMYLKEEVIMGPGLTRIKLVLATRLFAGKVLWQQNG